MHPSHHSLITPNKAALIMAATGETLSFADLEQRSNQGAHLFRACGLVFGDTVAVLLENHIRYLEIAWAAQRSGLYFVCVSSKLTPPEIEYIVRDSGAKLMIASPAVGPVAAADLASRLADIALFMVDSAVEPFRSWDAETICHPGAPIPDQRAGGDMLYSSGTTGRPKGIRPELPADGDIAAPTSLSTVAEAYFGFDSDTVYLCPAPLYHAAPLRWSMTTQKLGGTVILMEKFEPEAALSFVSRYSITHSQWVPTHFVRMLKLPEAVRKSYDISSLKLAVHAAAPCPAQVKQAMIDWWGPILVEYYAGTEGNGMTMIGSEAWLSHPGSVGKAVVGVLRICDEAGDPLPPRREGVVHFEGGPAFTYHNNPSETAAARNRHGWTSLGDVGWVDEDGYLYLTDRKSFMIISGGVNIYPQEIENLLISHPAVMDAAVIGAPDAEMGERVVAVIQPVDWSDANDAMKLELGTWLRQQLSGVKVPRQIDFLPELPRHATGKLYKRLLRDRYWGKTDTTIV